MPKSNLQQKLEENRKKVLAQRWRQADNTVRRQSTDFVPAKKKSKPLGYKMQNTFERSLKGVPGGRGGASIIKMVAAKGTGTKTVDKAPGTMKSMRNANTTQGSYNTTVLQDQTGDVVSNAQGRRM